MYIMFSLSFNFVRVNLVKNNFSKAYGNNNLKGDVFQYYPSDTRPYMFICVVVVLILLALFVPLYNIANCELIEEYPCAKAFIRDSKNKVRKSRLYIFRTVAIVVSCVLSFITDEVAVVLNLGGALIIPIISFYLPMFLSRTHA